MTLPQSQRRHHVVIVGSGFGGLFAARALRKAPVDVTVVARTTHHLFQPLLYQVATGILSPGEVAPATREILKRQRNARVILGDVKKIDLAARTVTADAPEIETVTPYDSLILAAGSGQSYFGNDRFAEFAPGMKSIDDALELRGRIFGAFELAEIEDDPQGARPADDVRRRRRRPDRRRDGRPDRGARPAHPEERLPPDRSPRSKIILLDAADRVLPGFDERLAKYTAKKLSRLGVDIELGAMVVGMDSERPRDQGHRRQPPAHRGHHQDLGRRCRGQPAGQAGRRAVGRRGRPRRAGEGPAGLHAARSPRGLRRRRHDGDEPAGRGAGRDAERQVRGEAHRGRLAGQEEHEPFSYFDKGSMATISRFSRDRRHRNGKIRLTGFIAWLAWLFIHIIYLIGFKNRVTTLLHWFVSFIGQGRGNARSHAAGLRPDGDAPARRGGAGSPAGRARRRASPRHAAGRGRKQGGPAACSQRAAHASNLRPGPDWASVGGRDHPLRRGRLADRALAVPGAAPRRVRPSPPRLGVRAARGLRGRAG